jgi:RNA polymerase sigma-70 factor (ECF subfamily)
VKGDATKRQEFAAQMLPIVQRRVKRALSAHERSVRSTARRHDPRDIVQDVFVTLLEREGHVLASWDPERGLSLPNFIGLVAERQVRSLLRSKQRSGWAEDPLGDLADEHEAVLHSEGRVLARQELSALMSYLAERLSPRTVPLLHAVFVHDDSTEEVCETFALTANALYTFKSRLRTLTRLWKGHWDSPSQSRSGDLHEMRAARKV